MIDPSKTVAGIVLDHSECASVFHRHRIDFCCRGDLSVREACTRAGLDESALMSELAQAIAHRDAPAGGDPRSMPTGALVDHIVRKHHVYLRDALPFVQALAAKVSRVHGERDPRLTQLAALVQELSSVLLPHLDEEEQSLFPLLVEGPRDAARVAHELSVMHEDHLAVGAMLERLRDITGDYRLPDWACTSYRTLFSELSELEHDVLAHVHLENHVLMPRFAAS